MPGTSYKPKEIVAKLRQVDVSTSDPSESSRSWCLDRVPAALLEGCSMAVSQEEESFEPRQERKAGKQ